jgi:hypothetical protein
VTYTTLPVYRKSCCDIIGPTCTYLPFLERQTYTTLSFSCLWQVGWSANRPLKSGTGKSCGPVYCSAYYPWMSLEKLERTTKRPFMITGLQSETYTGNLPNRECYGVTATIGEKLLFLHWKCFLNNHQRHIYIDLTGVCWTAVCATNSTGVVNKGQFVITQCTAWSIV